MEATAPGESRVSVRGLWKLYGPHPPEITPELAAKSKAELLEDSGTVLALKDVSFDVAAGETFVVMGLSGGGKSTLVRTLIRLIEPTWGEILVDGENILDYTQEQLKELRRTKTAMVFQSYGLLPHRNVIDNAAYGLEVQGVDKQARYAKTTEVLELVGLQGWEGAYPDELSGGMQQRVGLARALVLDPEILLMDEPFSGLDPLIRREMQDELIKIQRELRKTIIFITHDLSEALKLGDRVAIMRDGVVVQIGSPEEIVLSPEDDYVEQFTRDVRREAVLTTASVMAQPGTVVVDDQRPEAALDAMNRNASPVTMVVDAVGHYLGLLTLEQAMAAEQAGEESVGVRLTSHGPTASPEMPLDELIPKSLAADQLIPVVDDEGKLVGEVHRTALAARINGNRNGDRNEDEAAQVSHGGVQGHDAKERSLLPGLSRTQGRPTQ